MKYLLIIALAVQAYGIVGNNSYYTKCNTVEQAKFVLTCIKNANPKSDEEPEDWIYECKNMSLDMFCTKKSYGYFYETRMFSPTINCKCTECEDEEAISACKQKGWVTK